MVSFVLICEDCPQPSFVTHVLAASRSPQDPDGNIVMSIAENRLTVDLIKEKLQCQHHFPDSVFFYDNMTGSDRLKAAMLTLVHSTFMQVDLQNNCFIDNCLTVYRSIMMTSMTTLVVTLLTSCRA